MTSGGSERAAAQRRTAIGAIVAATALVGLKLGVGLAAASLALVSAGIESSGDVLAAAMTFFAVRLGGQPPDPEHPYGHARAENLGALAEAGILLAGGTIVAIEAVVRLVNQHGTPDTRWFVFAVVGVALCVDAGRTLASFRAARRWHSPAMRSNAFHFASDMAGSIVVLVGLLAVRAGVQQGDAIAALVIAGLIIAAAVRLIAENANVLMDRTPVQARELALRALTQLEPEIDTVRLRLRESGGRYFADAVVAVPPGRAVVEGHRAADVVEQTIQAVLPDSDVVVHVEPRRDGLDLRERVLEIALEEPLVKEVHDITVYEQGGRANVSLHLKFPADLDLDTAVAVSERVERNICSSPRVADVQTHLEPLEQPLVAGALEPERDAQERLVIERIVSEQTGRASVRTRLLCTEDGRVLFVTLDVEPDLSLVAAHELASTLEEELRGRLANIAEVVVHTGHRRPV
ncbi:MAG TPA: cation diffusion facilitator family transporter [Solirubrobacteraceae bacterium]|nr:cation diffusion facilitator family transporter [Solirubrobacteraceae bacterium]